MQGVVSYSPKSLRLLDRVLKAMGASFEIAVGIGVKSGTTWDAYTLKETKKIIKKV